jgi:hypothetical protein
MSVTAYPAVPNVPPSADGRYEWRKHWLYGWRLPVMILGSLAWWPIGLVLFAFFAWRHGMPSRADFAWMTPWKQRARDAVSGAFPQATSSGNAAFDEHRAATLRRLEEERRALDAQQAEFSAFLHQLRRAKDQEEFDRFMASRQASPEASRRAGADTFRQGGQDAFRQDGPDAPRHA